MGKASSYTKKVLTEQYENGKYMFIPKNKVYEFFRLEMLSNEYFSQHMQAEDQTLDLQKKMDQYLGGVDRFIPPPPLNQGVQRENPLVELNNFYKSLKNETSSHDPFNTRASKFAFLNVFPIIANALE